jgi:hypothetical protein
VYVSEGNKYCYGQGGGTQRTEITTGTSKSTGHAHTSRGIKVKKKEVGYKEEEKKCTLTERERRETATVPAASKATLGQWGAAPDPERQTLTDVNDATDTVVTASK